MDWTEITTQVLNTIRFNDYHFIKQIKVTPDFYEYLSVKCKENIYLVNNSPLDYIMGIPIIVDNTLKNPYEFIYSKENEL